MTETAIRNRAVIALPGADDFVEITRRQGREAPVVHFLSDTQSRGDERRVSPDAARRG
jgi:hypothetical protein